MVAMKNITRVFIHGLDSSSRGPKGTFFREQYPGMIIEDFTGPLEQRMAQLEQSLAAKSRLILVGSSYGGLMAALFAFRNEKRTKKLILLAPALDHGNFRPYTILLETPVILYHGQQDLVVPPEPTRLIAKRLFRNLEIHQVDDDHDLHLVFPTLDWNELLEIEGRTSSGSR
jgi:pimeloyl-ACP methyl ester carboxylesterase